ncbi:MAG TPA: hypothetical protein VKB03_16445 [Conexibacter sp.]|nr:hypothetical protein [Conexibacter sp.]
MTKGVSCRGGARIVHRALDHPGCTPTARQRASNEGCFGSTHVGRWLCHGLFPGEGYDLHCESGRRRIHAGAGG